MLSRLSVKNFRLLRDVTIDVEPGKPIVLVGPNGAGKSSVIQVLDLLGRAARDGLKEALKAFGGARALVSVAAPNTELSVNVVANSEDYSLRLGTSAVEEETLVTRDQHGSEHTLSRDSVPR